MAGPGPGYRDGQRALAIQRAEYGTGMRVERFAPAGVPGARGTPSVARDPTIWAAIRGTPGKVARRLVLSFNNRAAHARVHEKDVINVAGRYRLLPGSSSNHARQYGADYRFADVTQLLLADSE